MTATLITNIHIFDGTGAPAFPGEVLVEHDRITRISHGSDVIDAAGAAIIDGHGGFLMPGLCDAHAHLGFGSTVDRIITRRKRPVEEQMMLLTHAAKTMLDFGFTSAYSGGANNTVAELFLRDEIAAGWIPGPRLRACSFERSASAGSGLPVYEGRDARVPDVEGVRNFVAEMAELGVDSVKFVLSGESGVHPGTSRILQFYEEELAAAAEAARESGVWLVAHTHAAEAIKMALRHHVRVLYHCTWADEEALDLLEARKHEVFVAPAPGINWANCFEGEAFGFTRERAEEHEQFRTLDLVTQLVPKLRVRGIRVLPGGDYGFAWNPIGKNARDLEIFVKLFGFTPAEALMAATQQGGHIMGMANELGLIREGFLADLLIVSGDPLADISILQNRQRLVLIMQGGKIHKNILDLPELPEDGSEVGFGLSESALATMRAGAGRDPEFRDA